MGARRKVFHHFRPDDEPASRGGTTRMGPRIGAVLLGSLDGCRGTENRRVAASEQRPLGVGRGSPAPPAIPCAVSQYFGTSRPFCHATDRRCRSADDRPFAPLPGDEAIGGGERLL